jgi:hypothetical protein
MGIQLGALAHRVSRRPLPPPLVGVANRGPHDLGPLERAGRQHDGASCGAAVLAMLAALGDPALAAWLITGSVAAARPPELRGAAPQQLEALAGRPIEHRSAALQRVLKRRATSGVIGWPGALGTPPWGLARTARFPGVAYRHLPVDDAGPHFADVLDRVSAAAALGVPVPLYSGGDSSRGWASAVPRHVVLVVGAGPRGLRIWEPGEGRCRTVSRADLARREPLPALGRWSRVVWAVIPVADPLAS